MAANIRDALYQSSEVISHLLNQADPACWGDFTQEQLSDCVNVCFAVAGLLEIAESGRPQQKKGRETNDEN